MFVAVEMGRWLLRLNILCLKEWEDVIHQLHVPHTHHHHVQQVEFNAYLESFSVWFFLLIHVHDAITEVKQTSLTPTDSSDVCKQINETPLKLVWRKFHVNLCENFCWNQNAGDWEIDQLERIGKAFCFHWFHSSSFKVIRNVTKRVVQSLELSQS